MSTIKDVAKKAGVAISTVSAVINRSAPTSAAVVARVERAIAEIGYMPQSAAQTLRSGQSRLIGLIIPDIANPHFATVARVVETHCLRAGFMTFVYNTNEDADHEMRILRMMRMQRVAGLVLISTRSSARHGARLMAEINVPTVLMGSNVLGTPFDVVTLDEIAAGRRAAGHLLDLGHRHIMVIAGRIGVSTNDERVKGCQMAFAERGLELGAERVVHANFKEEQAFVETRRAMSEKQRPTAIVSLSNMMTIGVMRALVAERVESPREVSLVGVDDFDWADLMHPTPTTIAQPITEMTEEVMSMLLEEITNGRKASGRRFTFEPAFVERNSCAALRPVPSQGDVLA